MRDGIGTQCCHYKEINSRFVIDIKFVVCVKIYTKCAVFIILIKSRVHELVVLSGDKNHYFSVSINIVYHPETLVINARR